MLNRFPTSGGEGIRTPGSVAATAVFKNEADAAESVALRENWSIGDPRSPEISPVEGVAAHSVPIQPTDSELERGILDAMRLGLVDIARTLSAQLDKRRRPITPDNVVPIDRGKGKR
jgi:hypothetical protein